MIEVFDEARESSQCDVGPLRVMHVCDSIKGGVATIVNGLIASQKQDSGVKTVNVICPREHRQYLPAAADCETLTYPYPKRGIASVKSLAQGIHRSIHSGEFDVVHLHASLPGAIGRLVHALSFSKPSKRPAIVYCAHGWSFLMDIPSWKQSVYSMTEKSLAKLADRIICISNDELLEAKRLGISDSRVQRIYNGFSIDPPPHEPVDLPDRVRLAKKEGRRIFLFLGRYDPQKGLDLLLESFRDDNAPGELICAGGAVLSSSSMSFGRHSHDVGWVSGGQISTLLDFCDAMIVPSRWEGFGNVAAEAMRSSVPVIASNVGGLPEVVQDEQTGWILSDFRSQNLIDFLKSIPADEYRKRGFAGRARYVQCFTDTRMHLETLKLYQDAVCELKRTPLRVGNAV